MRPLGCHHVRVRRVVILGRGAAGKSVLARQVGSLTGLPVIELDKLFWQAGLTPPDPGGWAARQRELAAQDAWIADGDLGPFDQALPVRLSRADTVIVIDLGLLRSIWRTVRRGPERGDYWRWVLAYRCRYLPQILSAIAENAPHAQVHLLRSPAMVRQLLAKAAPQHPPGT